MQQVQCIPCAEPMTVLHVARCPGGEALRFRHSLRRSIADLLAESADARVWLHANRRLSLAELFARLFPPPPAATRDDTLRHEARCFMGAFTRRESNAAAKTLGVAESDAKQSLMERLRLLCVEQFDAAFKRWKAPP